MFPDNLEGAKVIEYTERGNYGFVVDPWNDEKKMKKEVCYIAICRYEDGEGFNVFWCDEEYRVLQDWLWSSVEECKQMHEEAEDALWYKK